MRCFRIELKEQISEKRIHGVIVRIFRRWSTTVCWIFSRQIRWFCKTPFTTFIRLSLGAAVFRKLAQDFAFCIEARKKIAYQTGHIS